MQVPEWFKHLGLVISSDLSWSNHITSISAKAKRILGLLYRQYYNHVEGHVLKQLWYLTCQTTPGIQLCTLKDKRNLEQVQKFACKMASKHCLRCWIRGSTGTSGFTSTWAEENLSGIMSTIQNRSWPVSIPHLEFLLPGKFLTTLGWIPFNFISHLHELMLFISLSPLTPFPYGTHFTLNRLLIHILSLSITSDHNVFVLVFLLHRRL